MRRFCSFFNYNFGSAKCIMSGRSTTEAIYLIRGLIKRYRSIRKDLYMIFIDLEKAYDRVSRDLLWKVLEKKEV